MMPKFPINNPPRSTGALRAELKRCQVTAVHDAGRHFCAGRRVSVGCRFLLAISLLLPLQFAYPCNYGSDYGLDPGDSSQTDVDGLFRGIYEEGRGYRTADWRAEAKDLEAAGNGTSEDIFQRLDYAWVLHMAAENEQSLKIYEGILAEDPNQYETLCSYGTVLHNMRRYSEATAALQKAVMLKPGFRNRAEEFHLAMIDFQQKSAVNPKYGSEHIFIDELTPLWKNRSSDVEKNFSTVDFPEAITSEGIAELMRQFPRFGDGWLALGMLLEHEEDFSMAAKCYDEALEKGTAHAEKLRRYMATFREFGKSQDPARLGGKRVVQLGIAIIALIIAWFSLKMISGIVSDITAKRADKKNKKRAERLKNFKDPDAPL